MMAVHEHSVTGPLGCIGCANCRRETLAALSGARLTDLQWLVLASLASGGARFVAGSTVRVVRKLVAAGLATLRDDGKMGRGNWDGERWFADVTDLGRKASAWRVFEIRQAIAARASRCRP